MKVQKIVRAQGEFAVKGQDINAGDVVTIKNEGQMIEGQFGQQFVILVETKNGDKNVNFNQTTVNILHDELGDDTTQWVGKQVVIRAKKDVVAGKKVDIYYFVTPDWDFDEYRELVKVIQNGLPANKPVTNQVDTSEPSIEELPF
jgi:hypothetical protein